VVALTVALRLPKQPARRMESALPAL
jgi:hypothetical protein